MTAVGDDLVIMPTVDLGNGPKVGGGSWQWGVTSKCANSEAAMDYLSYALKPENVAAVAKATGTIRPRTKPQRSFPSTPTAAPAGFTWTSPASTR